MAFRWVVFVFFLFLSGCLGIGRNGGIMGYHGGTVLTGTRKFSVSPLPSPWKSPKVRSKQLVHQNDEIGATIVTDVLCGAKFDDAPLPRLGREMFQGLKEVTILREKEFTLEGSDAFRVTGKGTSQGVSIQMDVVVMKKDFCLYDFAYFAPSSTFSKGVNDFEGYFNGFRTQ